MLKNILVIVLVLIVASCSSSKSDEALLEKIHQELQPVRTMTNGYKILNLDSLANFPWDKAYFIRDDSGFDTNKLVSAKLGFSWTGPVIPNNSTRLMLVRQYEVAAYVDFPEDLPVSAYGCPNGSGYISREQSKFAVFRYCERGYITYPLVPLECLNHFRDLLTKGCGDLPN